MRRPGERIRSIASRLFRPETMERVFDPIVADLQCEHGDALVRGLLWRARLRLLRGYLGLGRALICLGMLSISYIACMGVLAAMPSGPSMPPFVQLWTPNVTFLLVACALLLRGERPRTI